MKIYLAVTDIDWYHFLRQEHPEEVNFWQPGGTQGFKVLPVGGPFLFKLKAPINAIAGIGFFASHTRLPLSVAWEIFGRSNGTDNYNVFKSKITGYRRDNQPNPVIGCIILTDPVFFDEADWIPVPKNWASSIVQGKSYNTDDAIGNQLWSQVTYLLRRYKWLDRKITPEQQLVTEAAAPEYREILARVRVGQGTFRALVTDVYQRRCAISGEKTLPVLEAAHIRPYAQAGPHTINNGLLLRSDLHKLFDTGYITLTNDLQVEVSGRIREEFENGKEYYRFQGQKMLILPQQINQQPDPQYLTWHQNNVFNG